MNPPRETTPGAACPSCGRRVLLVLATLQAVMYAFIAGLSTAFEHDVPFDERPLLLVLALFGACLAASMASVAVAVRLGDSRWVAGVIVAAAIGFRVLLLATPPIQEVDIYRYAWDGAVTSHGISPYHFPPAVVLESHDGTTPAASAEDQRLARLLEALQKSPGLVDLLRRVHYSELTTIYPPVSQAVFMGASLLTPFDASVWARVTIMKAVLVAFDMATLGLVFWLLRMTGRPMGLAILYGWCPLVIKEIANSGHLDSIAVCLTTAAVCCAAKLWSQCGTHRSQGGFASAMLLGLAVGAKIYSVVLIPLLSIVAASRGGARQAAITGVVAVLVSAACLAPMAWTAFDDHPIIARDTVDTTTGLAAFVSRWEINDLIFMIVFENLRPVDPASPSAQAWFSIVPHGWRSMAIGPSASAFGIDPDRVAFMAARALTGLTFVMIVSWLVVRVARDPSLPRFLEATFLTIAWFWLLAPTQNSWYWIWTIPLLPFAHGVAWRAVSGLVFLSYLRFWLTYHFPEAGVLGTAYDGTQFFDFVIPWVEFGPWYVWLVTAASMCGPLHRANGVWPVRYFFRDTCPSDTKKPRQA